MKWLLLFWLAMGGTTVALIWRESRKAPTIETNDDWNEL